MILHLTFYFVYFMFCLACMTCVQPVQVILPRVIDTTQRTATGAKAKQQFATNTSFAPKATRLPFVRNSILDYPVSGTNSQYSTTQGIPVISPIQRVHPVHQVLLNPYLPPMQTSFLKESPTIVEESEMERKFSSLNTRSQRKPLRFQSMRLVRKRNIERFYPNTEYGDNFVEINNNRNGISDNGEDLHDDIIYANYPSSVNIKSDISGVEQFENLTDSIQVCEESLSTSSLNRPIPAPRTKLSPFTSPTKADHVYVNLSMPLISTKLSKSFDVIDAPLRPFKSATDLTNKMSSDIKRTTDQSVSDTDESEDRNKKKHNEVEFTKPNIIAATPKKTVSITLPSATLVKSAVNQLNEQGMNRVGPPAAKQVILPNKTLQIPKLNERPVPKRCTVKRSNSVQPDQTMDSGNGQV